MSEEELRKALEIMTKPMTLEEIKNFKYTFFDNSGDEESFTLEDYLDLSNNVYNLERENQQLKEKVGELTQSLNEQMKETNKENLDCSKYAIENQQLKDKINTYENPEDLTLMFMYCDEKAKDKIKQLKEVIKEVRKSLEDYQEYIDEAKEFYSDLEDDDVVKVSNLQLLNNQMVRNYDLLQILDKVKGE